MINLIGALMKTALYIFIGGGLGSVSRFAVGRVSTLLFGLGYPIGTFIANVLASLVLGFISGKLIETDVFWKPLLAIGFCGGFSTFSTFSQDTLRLFSEGRGGEALANIGLNVCGCLVAIYFGMQWAK